MGKNSAIKTLGNRIGNVVLHKLLVKYTNRPESVNHLQTEEITYRDSAIKDAKKYNWNERDKNDLFIIAIKFIKEKREKKYSDVNFPLQEAKDLIDEEILNLGI